MRNEQPVRVTRTDSGSRRSREGGATGEQGGSGRTVNPRALTDLVETKRECMDIEQQRDAGRPHQALR